MTSSVFNVIGSATLSDKSEANSSETTKTRERIERLAVSVYLAVGARFKEPWVIVGKK